MAPTQYDAERTGHALIEALGPTGQEPPAQRYVATINIVGYLPMDDDPPVLETTREAWEYLRDERERGLDQAEDWDEDDETLAVLDALAKGDSKNGDETGTVIGPTPGYDGDHDLGLAYSVSIYEED